MVATTTIDPILAELEQAATRDDLRATARDVRDHYAIDHVLYHWVDSAGDQYGGGTYPREWLDHYVERNYIRVDPVVQSCYQVFHPVDWRKLDWSSKAARAFKEESLKFGLGSQGYSIPIRGPNGQFALFSANHSCSDAEWDTFTDEHRRELILIAHYMNEKALEFEPGRAPEQAQPLSPREIDAMTLLAMGYNRAQVANTLSISEHTLRVYIESARFKLGALNTTHAVARAIGRGIIVV